MIRDAVKFAEARKRRPRHQGGGIDVRKLKRFSGLTKKPGKYWPAGPRQNCGDRGISPKRVHG